MGSGSPERTFNNNLLKKGEFHDIYILGVLWIARLLELGCGETLTPSLSSFKEAWKTLHFSHIFDAKPKNSTYEAFMQTLYNVCFMIPTLHMKEEDLQHLLGELEGNSLIDKLDGQRLEELWKDLSRVAALYCLFCIFEAQPNRPRVLVRIQEEHYASFREFSGLLKYGEDAQHVFVKMWSENAFCFGASYFNKSSTIDGQYHPGAGSISLTAGLDPLDAVTLRESRYHLDSTLRGLGTQYVESLCSQYQSALSNVMIDKRLDDTPESYSLKGIADLNFGYEIHKNVLLASDQIRYALYGKEHGNKILKTRKSTSVSRKPKVKFSKSLAGANAVLEREQARARDINHKRRCMEKNIGLIESGRIEIKKSSSDEDSDMPDLWESLTPVNSAALIHLDSPTYPKAMNCFYPNNGSLENHNGKNLKFKRVLTTCPQQYQDRLASAVIRHGGRPIWIPGIRINELSSEKYRKYRNSSLDKLETVKYLVLPSKNAISACLKACGDSVGVFQQKLNGEYRDIEVWAMGADADYLRETLGIRNVMKPKVASTDGIIEAMKENFIDQGNALVFVPEVLPPLTEPDVVPNFLKNLKTLGIEPHRIPAYDTTVGPSLQEVEPEVKMLMEGSIRAIAFTSTAESEGLCHVIGKDRLLQCIIAHDIVIAAHGFTTARGVAKMLNYSGKVCVSKDSSTFEGIVAAIAENI